MIGDEIDKIIFFYLGRCSEEDKKELAAWVNESEKHLMEFKEVIGVCQRLHLKFAREFAGDMESQVIKECRKRMRIRNRFQRGRRFAVAATIALLMGISIFYYMFTQEREKEELSRDVSLQEFKPGQQFAVLVLESGDEIELSGDDKRELRIGNGVVLKQNLICFKEEPVGTSKKETGGKVEYNTIRVPQGGEYNVTLADGTMIWMNSASELKFPVRFVDGVREVYLEGEAFFEVAPDSTLPFVVKTNDIRVEVLGTSFNIKAYKNEADVAATLFTGKVCMTPLMDTTNRVVLSVGEQACWNQRAKTLNVSEVNLDRVMAWRKGVFMFSAENIDAVMHQIERWYGVKFVYETKRKEDYVFNGYFSKDETLQSILEIFTLAGGPEFKIDGNVVYVRDNNKKWSN